MNSELASRVTEHIAELEELHRQLRAGGSDPATLLSIERLEQSMRLFRTMLEELGQGSGTGSA